ncbi:MAG: hypothetical protein OEM38_05235 [Gammaproteobacteria bacterium]|nr:hypothetical protein [Gammaproteobacteria bacterium]
MKFNIAYVGPDYLFNVRRDLILSIKYSLEENGHDVVLSGLDIDSNRFNLIIGAYFLKPQDAINLINSGAKFALINTEIIANDLLNHNPKKVDFLGFYLPFMQAGVFVWDIVIDNMIEHERYGNNAHFLQLGYLQELDEINRSSFKEYDYYFFGLMSPRRIEIINKLDSSGFRGVVDGFCPYFVRNDRISRSKVQLNLIQDNIYTHVNALRIAYLANNECAILSEKENDEADYLDFATVTESDSILDAMTNLLENDNYLQVGSEKYLEYKKKPMKIYMEILLENSFSV